VTESPRFRIRPARAADAPALCALLNRIIAIGGTTALETPLTPERFAAGFLEGPRFLCCFVAEAEGEAEGGAGGGESGALLGFQALERSPKLPADWGDIATFAQVQPKVPGVGRALFAATRDQARALGLTAINATIRADNHGGLAFYGKMGFEDWKRDAAVPLQDGTPVDRVSKRYRLG